jgi:hypothetical protein
LRVKDPLNMTPRLATPVDAIRLDTTPRASTPPGDIIHPSTAAEDELYDARKAEALNARAQAIISAASALAGCFDSSVPAAAANAPAAAAYAPAASASALIGPASAVAAEKLMKAGYTNVSDFRGGIAEWLQHGFPLEGSGPQVESVSHDGVFEVSTDTSVVRWTGRNLFNHHHGIVKLAGGRIEIEKGVLKAARFTLDMNSIACEDLVDTAYNAMLIRHLRDDDFFAVDRFPAAEFICDRAEPLPACTDGTPHTELSTARPAHTPRCHEALELPRRHRGGGWRSSHGTGAV